MKQLVILFLFLSASVCTQAQGLGIPSKRGGIGFGNLTKFTGIRFNYKDKNVDRINGINVTIWQNELEEEQTGTMTGIALGLPLAMGVENQRGISIGIGGAGATRTISGINIGGLGVGAGEKASGLNIGGLGVGAGDQLAGITIGGLGAGAGGDIKGITLGGLGVGAGGNLTGFTFGGLGIGAGESIRGINVGGLGVGAAENISGISASLLGIGAGEKIRGITIAGIGMGAGDQIQGIAIAGVGMGSETIKALAVTPVLGAVSVTGFILAPVYMQVGYTSKHQRLGDSELGDSTITELTEGMFKGLSVSAYNNIKGDQVGVTLGIVNRTHSIRGVQFGLINIVKENPRGLRVLPIFNTRFRRKE